MKIVTPTQMKRLESTADADGVSYERLMLNAGSILADRVLQHAKYNDNILFLCGNGNNAGDCFVAAKILCEYHGLHVIVAMLCGEPKTELSKKMFIELPKSVKLTYDLKAIKYNMGQAGIICDGIFGTGFHGEFSDQIQELLSTKTNAYIIAVDVPSGVNCNTGMISSGTLKADETITFAYPKLGMIIYPACMYCGTIVTANIGITEEHYHTSIETIDGSMFLLEKASVNLPKRSNLGNKGTFGRVLHVTGSKRMIGACIMASRSALRCGVGLVTICTECPELLPLAMPEPIYIDRHHESILNELKRSTGVLIGCGLGTSNESVNLFKYVVSATDCPLIIDADGINILSKCIDIINGKRVVLTPHPLEMSRLTGLSVEEIQSHRIDIARNFAKCHNCIVILKGANTIVTDGRQSFIDSTANSGMSKGGSGDVLAGIVSSFIAQGVDIFEACKLAVYIHSQSGLECARRLTQYSMLPTDLIEEIPHVIDTLNPIKESS